MTEFEFSPEIGALAKAMAVVQGAMDVAKKDADNPAFKRDGKALKYADLSSIAEACREHLSAQFIAVWQSPGEAADGTVSMTTMLAHESGQWVKGRLTIPLSKIDAHGYGSATTYARRYALAAMVGVITEDDDGNAASNPSGADNNRRMIDAAMNAPTRPKAPPLTGKHKTRAAARTAYGEIVRELHACGDADMLESCLLLYKEDFEQFRNEIPLAWEGDGGEIIGMKQEIENARARVAQD